MAGKSRIRVDRDGRKQKRCSKCRDWLALDGFQEDRSQSSGFKSRCRVCYNGDQKAKRDLDPEADAARVGEYHQKARTAADERDAATIAQADRAARRLAKEEERSAAKQRRLDSDIEPLRADDFSSDDDFDTGVANDSRPGATQLSAKAGQEKRQEFNARMGRHMGAVRKAAVAEATGAGELIDKMPGESGDYVGKLAEQERRFGNRRLARSLSLFAAGEEQARRLWMMACRQYLTGRVQATGFATKPASKRIKRSVCLLLSDLHLGADLGADNPMPFRQVEEARRLEYVLRQALDYKPQYREDSELVLMLNGDVIEGLLMHDFRDGAPLTEQKIVFHRYFERFVAECARVYPKVRVFCQPGNHGRDRMRHPGRATSSKWDSTEVGIYYALSRACTGLKNVEFHIGFRAITKIDLHGAWFGLTHGDTEIKIGDPDTKSKDNASIIDRINSTQIYGARFAAWGFGHFHKPRYLPQSPRLLFNGALIPPNGHARTSGWIGEAQGQWLWEAVAGFPVGDVRFIEVGRAQDEDERLGKIIVPFRFDLDADNFA